MSLADTQLRVLVLDEEVPWPLNSGKRIRTWNLLRRLATRHALHLLTYGPVSKEAQQILSDHRVSVTALDALPTSRGPLFFARLFRNLFSEYPYSVSKHFTDRLQRAVVESCAGQDFDLAHIEWVPYARYATPGLARVLTAHNVEADIWRRRAQHSGTALGRQFFAIQAGRMEKFERRASVQSDCVIAVSELDAQRFRSHGASNVKVVPNGVDLDYFRPMPEVPQSDSLVFVGSLDWFPNEDAVRDFAVNVLPLIRSKNKQIKFRVVGRKPSEKLAAALHSIDGVELAGEVPDVRPHFAAASAVLVPLRIGGGTRIKILEALAMERPVISTSVGAEGLELEDGRDILIADSPQEFVARIETLVANPDLQLRLGRNGRKVVEAVYGWDAAAEKLEQVWFATARRIEATISSPAFAMGEARQ